MRRLLSVFVVMVLSLLMVNSAICVPVRDGLKDEDKLIELNQTMQKYYQLAQEYIHKWNQQAQSASGNVSTMNNGFANEIVRKNEKKDSIYNNHLKMSGSPVDVCSNISISHALNELTCNNLTNLSDKTNKFVLDSKNPELVANKASTNDINDITTISVTSTPSINNNDDIITQANQLKEQAVKTTVAVVTDSIKQDKENIYYPLMNQSIDDFSDAEIKKIQTKYNKSQLYRRMAVMIAQDNYAAMLSFKHQLEKETSLSIRLSSEVEQNY